MKRLRRLITTSVGPVYFDIPTRGVRRARYVVFDREGRETEHGSWWPASEIAASLADPDGLGLPEAEAAAIEAMVLSEIREASAASA